MNTEPDAPLTHTTVSLAEYERVLNELEQPAKPIPALVELFRRYDA